jgi:cysteine-rich repeat protein
MLVGLAFVLGGIAVVLPVARHGVARASDDLAAIGDGASLEADEVMCGNGVVETGEACDDGNLSDLDCCAPNCQPPVAVCLLPARTILFVNDDVVDGNDRLKWKWAKGTTTLRDFGNPLESTHYRLCVWDDGDLVLDSVVEAGGRCGLSACWNATTVGYSYENRATNADGASSLKLTEDAGKARIGFLAKGIRLVLPQAVSSTAFFSQTDDVRVRLVPSDTPVCWEGRFATSKKNTATQFRARALR